MFALAAANTTGSLFTMILIYAVIIGGFWFLLMRPQKKEQKRVAGDDCRDGSRRYCTYDERLLWRDY